MRAKVGLLTDVLQQALAALRDNRLRTVLSILGIAVGIAAVMAVGSVAKGGHYLIFSELETFGLKSVWVYKNDEEKDPRRAVRKGTGIDNDDYFAVLSGCCPAVVRVTPLVYGMEFANSGRLVVRSGNRYSNGRIEGVGADFTYINNDSLTKGRAFRAEDESRRRRVVIIGTRVQEDLFGLHQNPIGKEIRIGAEPYTVIGLLAPKSRDFLASIGSSGGQDANNRVLIPYSTYQQILGKKEIFVLQAEAVSLQSADAAAQQIKALLERRHRGQYSYKSETMAKYIGTAGNILKAVTLIGIIAASVSLLVGGLGIMNIMSTSVLERTREIGLRKALGARKNDILIQFLLEATLISTLGGSLGLILGAVTGHTLAWATGFPLSPSWGTVLVALAVSIGVGMLSGYYPAHRAAQLKPVEALRYE